MQHGRQPVSRSHRLSPRSIGLWYVSYLLLGLVVFGLTVILIPLVVVAAGHRPFRVGAVVACQNIGLLSAPFWGQVMDRYGRHRLVTLSGSMLIASGFMGLTLYTGLPYLLGSACLIGAGTAATTTATTVFIVGSRPQSEWSDRIGTLQLFNSIGTTLGLACAGLLSVHAGTVAGASLAAFSGLLIMSTAPASANPPAAAPAARYGGSREGDAPDTMPSLAEARAKAVTLRSVLICWFLVALGMSCFSSLYPVIMRRVFEVGVRRSSSVISLATFAGLPLYAVSGILIHRLGSSLTFAGGIACRFACLFGLGCLSLLDPARQSALLFVLAGAFQTCWPVLSVSANDQLFRASSLGRGLSLGLFGSVSALASAAGALLGGVAAEFAGYASVSAVAAVACGVALVLAVHLHRKAARPGRRHRSA